MKTKICCQCKKDKPLTEFGPRKTRPDGRNYHCRRCATDRQIARYAANPEKYREINRALGNVPKSRFNRFKKRCKHSSKDFDLTFEQWSNLVLDKTCHYCDGSLEPKGCGLDRKDNTIGYIIPNVVACCKECNRLKGPTLTYDEMLAVSAVLKQMRAI